MDIVAGAGERNDLVVMPAGGGGYAFRDAGAPVVAMGRCRQAGPAEARCPAPAFVRVALGDGDDRAVLEAMPLAQLDGGPGDDELSADGSTTMRGGDGDDVLLGGAGDQILVGDSAGLGADVLDGGPGNDEVSYRWRRGAVLIDLVDPARSQGEPGEGDVIRGVEHASGGHGDDVLIGTPIRNVLDGGGGDDRIDAGAGDDRITIGVGADTVNAGPGDDDVAARPGGAPGSIDCGPDNDTSDSGGADLHIGCEVWTRSPVRLLVPQHVDRRGVRVKLACDATEADYCSGTVRLLDRASGRLLARSAIRAVPGRLSIRPERHGSTTLRLSPAWISRLRRTPWTLVMRLTLAHHPFFHDVVTPRINARFVFRLTPPGL